MTVISAAWHGRGGPEPPPVPPLPAGSRRCTMLPSMAAPPQRPRCSVPARTRPSRTGKGTLRRATPHGRPPQPQPRCRQGNSGSIRTTSVLGIVARTRRRWSRRAAAPLAIASPTPAWGGAHFRALNYTRSPRHRTKQPHRWLSALAPARPSGQHDVPNLLQSSASPCACAAVPLRHAQRGGPTRFVVMHTLLTLHCECITQPNLTRGVAGQTCQGGE